MFGVNNRNTIGGIADCCRVLSRLRSVDTIFIRHFINKSGTSKVAAKPDAEKTQSYTNMLQDVYEKLTKKLRNTKRGLLCSANASEGFIVRAQTSMIAFLILGLLLSITV